MARKLSRLQKERLQSALISLRLSRRRAGFGPRLSFAGSIFLMAAAWVAFRATLPPELIMSLLVGLAMFLAGTFALIAQRSRSPHHAEDVTYADVAGALTLVGLCVAATIDSDQILRILDIGVAEIAVEYVSKAAK